MCRSPPLEKGLKALGIKGYRLREHQVIRNTMRATKVDVDIQTGLYKTLIACALSEKLDK